MLTIYKRIKEFRELRGMTQDSLAKAIGYSNRSAIARIENGEIDLPQSKILAIADALDVTPGMLMGTDGTIYAEDNKVTNKLTPHFDSYITGIGRIEDIAKYDAYGRSVQVLFSYLHKLNSEGIAKLTERAQELAELPKYQADSDKKEASP